MKEAQEQVARLMEEHRLMSDPKERFLDLSSELGELAKELLKAGGYGEKKPEITPGLTEELGDCVFSLLALCRSLGVNAEEAFEQTMEKYRQRLALTGRADSGR